MTVYISQITGDRHGQIDDADRERAIAAAIAYCTGAGVTPEAAAAAYRAQWVELEDESRMTGAARVWAEARCRADLALTSTWANRYADVFCVIDAD